MKSFNSNVHLASKKLLGHVIFEKNKAYKSSSNREKGKVLESAIKLALIDLKLKFRDTTDFYNGEYCEWIPLGSKPKNKRIFDFDSTYDIEAKNWNCIKYHIDITKAKEQILKRFSYSPKNKGKLVIISNPRWIKRAKKLVYSKNKVIELGFFVTWNNFSKAVHVIKKHLRRLLQLESDSKTSRVCNFSYRNNNSINNKSIIYNIDLCYLKSMFHKIKDKMRILQSEIRKLLLFLASFSLKSMFKSGRGGFMKNKEDNQIQHEITNWLPIQDSKKSNLCACVFDIDPFSSNRYFWERADCEENCWIYERCELADKRLRLYSEVCEKSQSNLVDNSTTQKERLQQSIKEYRETIRKMEKHYKQGWMIRKQGNKSWVKSLEYEK